MFMKRSAADDYIALLTADTMESAGATVVAITPNGESTYDGALIPHLQYIVWARVADVEHIHKVDDAIETMMHKPIHALQ